MSCDGDHYMQAIVHGRPKCSAELQGAASKSSCTINADMPELVVAAAT